MYGSRQRLSAPLSTIRPALSCSLSPREQPGLFLTTPFPERLTSRSIPEIAAATAGESER